MHRKPQQNKSHLLFVITLANM